ncbi:ATP-binding protein [Gilvimarinus polysaccharolyticus]|uniref:ATP-binding protein n=1 Tax=Gilvimarinus polysaccharolyticus TaxID=863921 RepID=UPI00067325D3|nr:ATP-binding protein [Gilvimarinus polysaccharolyticus]
MHQAQTKSTAFQPELRGLHLRGQIPYLLATLVIIASIATGGYYVGNLNNQNYILQQRDQVQDALGLVRAKLEGNLTGNLLAAQGLIPTLQINPDIDQDTYAQYAKHLFSGQTLLRNIGAAPNLVIKLIYPLEDNRAALGLNYRTQKGQTKAALQALETGRMTVAGPIDLMQGGQGLIGRIPVIIDTPAGDKRLWGLISAVIDLDKYYQASGLLQASETLDIAIRGKDGLGSKGDVFYGNPALFNQTAASVITKVELPGGYWEIAAKPKAGWPKNADNAPLIRYATALLIIITLLPTLWIIYLQQKRREQQQQLQALFDLSPLGISLIDAQTGLCLKANSAMLALNGCKAQNIKTLPTKPLTPPSQANSDQKQQTLLKTGRYGPYKTEFIRPDGSQVPVRLNGMFIRDNQGRQYIWSIAENITEQQAYEDRLLRQQQMLESMSEQANIGAWEVDTVLQTIYWSKITRSIHEVEDDYTPLMTEGINFYKEGRSRTLIQKRIEKAINDGESWSDELQIITAKGNERWVCTTGTAKLVDGKCIRLYGSFQDIHERKINEESLRKAKNSAVAAAAAKSEFLAMMSHEIRTPMNGVLGMLNMLKRSNINEEDQHKINIAKISAESLLSLINDILDFSKVEAGKFLLESTDFNLREVIDGFSHIFALRAQEKGLEFIIDLTDVNVSDVKGDAGRLKQVLTNLLSNAIKFTPSGNIILQCATKKTNTGIKFSASVCDSGIGISESKINSLFEPFVQEDASTTRQYGGTGLGLAICKKLCTLMGGEINASSTPNKGSCFSFSVQLQTGTISTYNAPSLAKSNTQIVLVSENLDMINALTRQLTDWGAKFYAEPTQSAALHLCQQQHLKNNKPIDLLIIDRTFNEHTLPTLPQDSKPKPFRQTVLMCGIDQEPEKHDFDQILYKPTTTRGLLQLLTTVNDHGGALTTSNSNSGNTQAALVKENHTWPEHTRILLVEDNLINQEVALLMLQELKLEADHASNGLEAINALKNTQKDRDYNLVLMDCQMPEMDGFEATRRIRAGEAGKKNQGIPIIALTANAIEGDREHCLREGMNDYLSKPIETQLLWLAIDRWITPERTHTEQSLPQALTQTTAPVIWDQAKALTSLFNRDDILKNVLNLFCQQLPNHLASAQHAYQQQDSEQLVLIAHSIKGSAGQLHGAVLQACAAKLERSAKEKSWDNIPSEFAEFTQAYKNLAAQFQQYLNINS